MPAQAVAQVNLHVHDVSKEYEYWTEVLGFTPDFRVRDPGRGGDVFAGCYRTIGPQRFNVIFGGIEEALHGHYDHAEFGKALEEHPLGTGVVLYFPVADVDKKHKEIVSRGAVIDEPPTDQFWGERTISVLTPAGFYVTFAKPIKGFRFPPGFEARIERAKAPKRAASGRATRAPARRAARRKAKAKRR